jgi:hypothetical protein
MGCGKFPKIFEESWKIPKNLSSKNHFAPNRQIEEGALTFAGRLNCVGEERVSGWQKEPA